MKKLVIIFAYIIVCGSLSFADENNDDEKNGLKHQIEYLQQQIDEIKAQLDAINLAGAIQVYDAENQYLGMLVGGGNQHLIYNPALQTVVMLELTTGHIFIGTLNFESNNCTGTGYNPNPYMFRHQNGAGGYRYYKPILKTLSFNGRSFHRGALDDICTERAASDWEGFEMVEVPEEDIPFYLPVALPIRYD